MFKKTSLSSAALLLASAAALAASPAQPGLVFKAHAVKTGQHISLHAPVIAGLYPLTAQFGLLPSKDENGQDEWPCFGGGGNADCASISDGGVVVGVPNYTWSLASCDNNSGTATPCGQISFSYQDQTNDSTDHLLVTITVKQGDNFILAEGPVDMGPNPFAGQVVVLSGDTAFGTLGQSGRGNGWCAGTKHTCVDPVQGVATGMVLVQLGQYRMRERFVIYLQ